RGWSVTSAAFSGVKHRSRKLRHELLTSRYSGRYLPAWRMYQKGTSFRLLFRVSINSVIPINQYKKEIYIRMVVYNGYMRVTGIIFYPRPYTQAEREKIYRNQ